MDKIVNIRDLGGLNTLDGRKVKKGLFFRSATLDYATIEDIDFLESLNIKTVFDFRDKSEIIVNNKINKLNIEYYNYPILLDSARICKLHNERTLKNALIPLEKQDMQIAYRNLPFGNESYYRLFNLIKEGNVPILFHCSVGKDRTGVAAAIILLMLNVERKEIINDYLISRKFEKEIMKFVTRNINILFRKKITKCMMPIFLADKSYIETAINEIFLRYNTVEDYFTNEYNISSKDIMDIRQRYTV